ncbi:hypothetical protein [Enterobacter hormaechei]|nr:hypothetical protein [Enterobacter hormaechei]
MCAQYCMPQALRQALTNLHNGNVWRTNRLHFLQQLALNAFFPALLRVRNWYRNGFR